MFSKNASSRFPLGASLFSVYSEQFEQLQRLKSTDNIGNYMDVRRDWFTYPHLSIYFYFFSLCSFVCKCQRRICMWEVTLNFSGVSLPMYGHTCSKSMDQPGKVANPARGQLNREK